MCCRRLERVIESGLDEIALDFKRLEEKQPENSTECQERKRN